MAEVFIQEEDKQKVSQMSKIIDIARKYIGVKESPENSNKTIFGVWAKLNGLAWCGLFVSKCYEEAGFPLPKIGFSFHGFAGCQTAVEYFRKNNQLTTSPVEGDIVFFDWNNDKRYDHTGLFVKMLEGDKFLTIEGNTSLANQSNGGEVMQRERHLLNVLFAHPKVS